MDDAALLERLEENQRAFRRAQADCAPSLLRRFEAAAGAEAYSLAADADKPWFHVALCDAHLMAQALPQVEAFFREVGVRAWRVVAPGEDRLASRTLRARGYLPQETTWAMGRLLEGAPEALLPALAADVEVVVAASPDALSPLNDATYGPTPDVLRALLRQMPPGPLHTRLLSREGRALSGGFTFEAGGTAGLYNVVTHPEARGQGLAEQLVRALLAGARERGCRAVVLQSSDMALGVYRRLGFRTLGTHVHWVHERPAH